MVKPSLVALFLSVIACAPSSGPMRASGEPPGWRRALTSERQSPFVTPGGAAVQRSFWDIDAAYRFVGPMRRYEHPERITLATTAGEERPAEKVGAVEFDLAGRRCRLQVYRLLDSAAEPGSRGLFLPFTDATTGRESYPAGRYVDLQEHASGGFVLDFNRAYNPLCAYGTPERYRCPVTPAENRLAAAVEAGERGWPGAGGDRAAVGDR